MGIHDCIERVQAVCSSSSVKLPELFAVEELQGVFLSASTARSKTTSTLSALLSYLQVRRQKDYIQLSGFRVDAPTEGEGQRRHAHW